MLTTILPATMFPLIKVPCILVAMVGLQIAVTPPHPPPGDEEEAPSTSLEVVLKQRSGPLIVKSLCWGAAIAEVSVIIANHTPSLSVSNTILSTLVLLDGGEKEIRTTPLFFVGTALTAFGGFVRYSCYKTLGKFFTFEMALRKDHRLVTVGPYSYVRHPGYTGVLLTMGGIICLHAGPGSWLRESGALQTTAVKSALACYFGLVCTIVSGLLRRMSVEDKALHKLFGKEWEEWERNVPYKLIPWIY